MSYDPHILISLFHLLLVVPFFLYVGLQQAATPESVYTALLVLGVIITLYHGYKSYNRWVNSSPMGKSYSYVVSGSFINLHWNKGKDTPRAYYEMLLLLAFGAGGYHLYSIVQQMNNVRVDH